MILLCAATRTEARACLLAIGGNAAFEVLQTGMGFENAQASLQARLENTSLSRPKKIISTGFAGLIKGSLRVGNWVQAYQIRCGEAPPISLPASLLDVPLVSFQSVPVLGFEPVITTEDPVMAVDMESWPMAEIALREGIPFSILRMLTDTAEKPLPLFLTSFNQAILSPNTKEKFALGLKGVWEALKAPHEVSSLLISGPQWARDLTRGWEKFTRKLMEDKQC